MFRRWQQPRDKEFPRDDFPAPVPAALSRAEIAELQRLLASLSLDPGPADGMPGAKTIEAIKLYQQMAGLKADGVLSRKLLEQIRELAGVGGAPR
jgi:peptidoglycan hydrolase-like protein with peptidoglycan-binding domain